MLTYYLLNAHFFLQNNLLSKFLCLTLSFHESHILVMKKTRKIIFPGPDFTSRKCADRTNFQRLHLQFLAKIFVFSDRAFKILSTLKIDRYP